MKAYNTKQYLEQAQIQSRWDWRCDWSCKLDAVQLLHAY